MATTFTLIKTYTLASAAASFDFTSIPSTYTDIKILVSGRTNSTNSNDYGIVQFNGDTSSSNYSYKQLYGDGTNAASSGGAVTGMLAFRFDGGTATASTFGNGELYIPNYAGSSQKSGSSDGVSENNATTAITSFFASLWTGTAAINSIKITPSSGSFVTYSTASLYGILKA
jgi:hypothetical protein